MKICSSFSINKDVGYMDYLQLSEKSIVLIRL